jgi:hypothetical protein
VMSGYPPRQAATVLPAKRGRASALNPPRCGDLRLSKRQRERAVGSRERARVTRAISIARRKHRSARVTSARRHSRRAISIRGGARPAANRRALARYGAFAVLAARVVPEVRCRSDCRAAHLRAARAAQPVPLQSPTIHVDALAGSGRLMDISRSAISSGHAARRTVDRGLTLTGGGCP